MGPWRGCGHIGLAGFGGCSSWQLAIPVGSSWQLGTSVEVLSVFAWLRDKMGVSCEVFASPLNCYFAEYYSAFPDVDVFFGSRGSFFDVENLPAGSYEVGPPYTEEVMELMARKLLRHLHSSQQAQEPLSFVVFVPHWGDECTALSLMGGPDFEQFRPAPCSPSSPYLLARGRPTTQNCRVQRWLQRWK
eukprot:Skav224085  [mRNA]  locus=scaffold942:355461:362238:+ [translate_table: standard]